MKNFKLENNEEVLLVHNDIKVKANTNEFTLTMFLTTNRLVLFKDVNKELEYNAFLQSRTVYIPANNEVVFTISLKEITKYSYREGVNHLTFKDGNNLYLYCENLSSYLTK